VIIIGHGGRGVSADDKLWKSIVVLRSFQLGWNLSVTEATRGNDNY